MGLFPRNVRVIHAAKKRILALLRKSMGAVEGKAIRQGALTARAGARYFHWMQTRTAKFALGSVVRHRIHPFRGVIFDVDPIFSNTEEWWQSIPENVRPSKDQPFYHLFAENSETQYLAYVSEQNLVPDTSGEPVTHPQISEMFTRTRDGQYKIKQPQRN